MRLITEKKLSWAGEFWITFFYIKRYTYLSINPSYPFLKYKNILSKILNGQGLIINCVVQYIIV